MILRKNKVSIITPVFNEEEGLGAYYSKIKELFLARNDMEFEILFIDDGSTDRSWNKIEGICKNDSSFRAIRFSRNFGSHIAVAAGLDISTGDVAVILACDLQDPPEVVFDFIERWKNGSQIVWGKRQSRNDPFWRTFFSRTFSYLLKKIAMPKNSLFTTGSFLLMDKKVVNCYRMFKEQNRVTFVLVAWTGFKQDIVLYNRQARICGKSGWTFQKMIKTVYDAVVGFSYVPIRLASLLGITISALNVPFALYVLINWALGYPKMGWTSTILAISIMGGLQLLILSMVCEYLYRVYQETTNRPLYFISADTNSHELNKGP